MAVFGHKQCRSNVEVVEKTAFDTHAHGNITRAGKMNGVARPMLLITDSAGNIVASRTFEGDLSINGTLTATKLAATGDATIVGTLTAQKLAANGDATVAGTLTAGKVIGAVYQ